MRGTLEGRRVHAVVMSERLLPAAAPDTKINIDREREATG